MLHSERRMKESAVVVSRDGRVGVHKVLLATRLFGSRVVSSMVGLGGVESFKQKEIQ